MTKYRNNFLSNTPSYDGDTSLLMNIRCYELYSLSGDSYNNYGGRRIVLWNPTTEKFKVIPPKFGVSVTLYGFGYDNVADDYKVIRQESWIKLFIVEQPCVGFPIGVGMKGEIFIQNIDDEIVWFDLTTKMIKELGLKGKRMEFLSGYPIANVTIIIKNLACTF
ncbi:F-box protein [Trifolium pratense]|uniref:F-box protein n=1 Tax=Trifolium pratense TaxID=57577 RepID=A0A2K3P4I0_TRIPR|nr:F-box protein [Trifolium pratense]